MIRGRTGSFSVSGAAGEPVRAFVPHPLPPAPPIDLTGERQLLLERALLALGRLDSVSSLLPEPALFLYAYVRKEAVLSSQIEGTRSSLSDLLLFELRDAPGVPVADAAEVSNYVAALSHGLKRLRAGFPLSNRLLREIHGVLLRRGRGGDKSPGEFRRSQSWIGGTRPGNARFVPPPPHEVAECMSRLEKFLHDPGTPLPILIRAALAHVQFETIHPFLDGNGRLGRLLITFLLCHAGVLREPLLYLSLYFKQRRAEYYRLLDVVREKGDWESWLDFFLEGVRSTADGAVAASKRLVELFQADRARIQSRGRAAGSALRVHAALQARPLSTQSGLAKATGLSFPAAGAGLKTLIALRIARETTGRRRGRVFAYDRFLAALSEGTEPVRG